MYRFSYTTVARNVFFTKMHAQASPGCDEISPHLDYNTSVNYTMTALQINGSYDEAVNNSDSLYAIAEDPSNSWTLALHLKAQEEDRAT